ncbi:MAG: nickel-dependent hydrogenase large subunit [Nitrososphaerota archaeon]|nr:nickel-dependent hydrogenase large subunit [Nitrososphaerales archaeon]MDW8044783.1 nickel-dependent hydrogenase large subunit [Nitrososphaerota archaeon]
MPKFSVDPVTRIEGHLCVELEISREPALRNEYVVKKAWSKAEMFRGFEIFLKGRDPRDAPYITQRICGVCPNPHAMASIQALDDAFGARPPPAAILVRNIIDAAYYIYDHLIHFYLLIGPELGVLAAYPPMVPPALGRDGIEQMKLGAHYAKCVEVQRLVNEVVALWGGKYPHIQSLYPGGVTVKPTLDKITNSVIKLVPVWEFVALTMISDLQVIISANERLKEVTNTVLGKRVGLEDIGIGTGNFLSYGLYPDFTDYDDWLDPSKRRKSLIRSGTWSNGTWTTLDENKITEHVKYSYYDSPSKLHPSEGETSVKKDKAGAYSWLKAPRYDGKVYEVGPLARFLNTFGTRWRLDRIHPITGKDYGPIEYTLRNPKGSVLDRVVARAFMTLLCANNVFKWLLELRQYVNSPIMNFKDVPREAKGRGLWEAPRGALGHWIKIKDGKIERYQCVVPGTWNWSPRDDMDNPGVGEQALQCGTTWIPKLNVFQLANAIKAGWGDTLREALTALNPKYVNLNMERTDGGESVNSSLVLLIVRSFDPCLACGVHLIMPDGKKHVIHIDHEH